jgi:hypothetical protein
MTGSGAAAALAVVGSLFAVERVVELQPSISKVQIVMIEMWCMNFIVVPHT